METAKILDTETTGMNDPEVIEFAHADVTAKAGPAFIMGAATVERFKPSRAIELGAMATHHILPEELADCPPVPASFPLPKFIIGHNVDFDWQALGAPADVKRICTLALAREAWPNLDSYKLGALTYKLHPYAEARDLLRNAHSAAVDIALCFRVFEAAMLTIPMDAPVTSWGDVWRVSEAARIPKIITFGKHKGLKIADVPRDYVGWYCRQAEPDPYLVKAFQKAGLA